MNHRKTGEKYAVKVFSKASMMTSKEQQDARKEAALLFELNHKNIVRYEDFYEDNKRIYIVME